MYVTVTVAREWGKGRVNRQNTEDVGAGTSMYDSMVVDERHCCVQTSWMCSLKKGHSHKPLTGDMACQHALWVWMLMRRGNGSENSFVCLLSSCSSFSVAVLNSGPKQLGEERVCLARRSPSQSSMGESLLGRSRRSLEAGTEAENMKERCLLPSSLHLLLGCLLGYHRTTCLLSGGTAPRWDGHSHTDR